MSVYLEFEIQERFKTANMTIPYYENSGDFGCDLSIFRLVLVSIGLSSNVIVATVLAFNRKMHTAPNCYVFSILTSDIIILIDVLWNVLINWFKFSLRIDGSYVACMTMEASIITIVMFTIERYDALCSPKSQAHPAFGFCNGVKSVLIIWSMAATFPALELNLNLHFLPDTQVLIFAMSTTIFLLVPTLVILTLVAFILFDTRNLKNNVDHDVSKVFGKYHFVVLMRLTSFHMLQWPSPRYSMSAWLRIGCCPWYGLYLQRYAVRKLYLTGVT